MAESYRGLTIRIGGDTSKLTKALRNTNGAITQTQQELRKVGQALKLDPGNIEAFSQQMGYMASQATNTASKLAMLKRTQEQMRDTHITLSTGEDGTIDELARAAMELGGEMESIAAKSATAHTKLAELTSTLGHMDNEMSDLTKQATKVERMKLSSAFDLATGKRSIEDVTKKFASLDDGIERTPAMVDEITRSVEEMAAKLRETIHVDEGVFDVSGLKKALVEMYESSGFKLKVSGDGSEAFQKRMAEIDEFGRSYKEKYDGIKAEEAALSEQREASLEKFRQDFYKVYDAATARVAELRKAQSDQWNENTQAVNEARAKDDAARDEINAGIEATKQKRDEDVAAIDAEIAEIKKMADAEEEARQAAKNRAEEVKGVIETRREEVKKRVDDALQSGTSTDDIGQIITQLDNQIKVLKEARKELSDRMPKIGFDQKSDIGKQIYGMAASVDSATRDMEHERSRLYYLNVEKMNMYDLQRATTMREVAEAERDSLQQGTEEHVEASRKVQDAIRRQIDAYNRLHDAMHNSLMNEKFIADDNVMGKTGDERVAAQELVKEAERAAKSEVGKYVAQKKKLERELVDANIDTQKSTEALTEAEKRYAAALADVDQKLKENAAAKKKAYDEKWAERETLKATIESDVDPSDEKAVEARKKAMQRDKELLAERKQIEEAGAAAFADASKEQVKALEERKASTVETANAEIEAQRKARDEMAAGSDEYRAAVKKRNEANDEARASIDKLVEETDKALGDLNESFDRESGGLSEQMAKKAEEAAKLTEKTIQGLAKYGSRMPGLSGEIFSNKNGNTDPDYVATVVDKIAASLGLSATETQKFKSAFEQLHKEFVNANDDVQKLNKVMKYQDLVAEVTKTEAGIKSLSKAMADMHMPSELMRGMYTLNADIKELQAAYGALFSTGGNLSSIFKSDPTNMTAATQAMNAFSAAEMVATETAERMRQRLDAFDADKIEGVTNHTKSATQQLFDASLAAEKAKDEYAELSGRMQFLQSVKAKLEGREPTLLSTDQKEVDAFNHAYEEAQKDLTAFEAEIVSTSAQLKKAEEANRFASEALDGAKMRKEYEELSSGATVYANNARKAAEAAREIFVQRSVAETFGDTSAMDRLQERISSLTSSANAFSAAFEFDPKNIDMAAASMARLQEAEDLATQRIAELGKKVFSMDTSKVDELRDKYGSVTAAVNEIREALAKQDVARSNLSDAIGAKSYLGGIRDRLFDPDAEFRDFELEFLPEGVRKAREEFVRLAKDGKTSMQELADAEKALKFEQMREQIATARMELEKLMRQEYDIVLRLSLQGEFGDTTKITEALDGAMQSAMGRVGTFDEALKFDTKNVDLLDSRMRAITDAMNLGTREAESLSAAMSRIDVSAVEEMRSTYGSVSNAVNMTTGAVNDLISKVAEQRAMMEAEEEGTDAYAKAKASVEALEAELEEAQKASAKAAQYEQWERYDEQLAKVRSSMERLKSDVREVAERNVEAFASNYSEGMFGDVDEQVASFDSAISKAEERYRRYTDALSKEPHDKLFKAEQTKALEEAVDLTTKKVAFLKQTMSQFDESKVAALKERYGSFGKAVDDSKLKLNATEAEIETLKQRVAEFGAKNGKSAEWIRQFTDAKSAIGTVPPELEKVRARLVELWDVQGEQQLELAIASVSSRLEELGDDANTAMAALRKTLQGEGTSFMDSAAFTQATQEMGQWARQAGQHIVDSANTIDSAYRDMRKTVEGTEEQFESLRQEAIAFSQTHAISADQMLEMEALGGQLGVTANDLAQFGELASNLSIATDIETNDVALQLGQMQNIMSDIGDMDSLERFGDALVRLGNNAAAQESAIMNVAQRIAAVANVTSMSSSQVLGWSAAIAETGQRSESAATALVRTITGIGDAVNKGGSTLENFAAIAGKSSEDFKTLWETSSSEALEAFVRGLETLTDDSTAAIQALDDVGISSVRQETALLALSQTVDNVSDNIAMSEHAFEGASDQWGAAGDAAREAQNKSEGFSGSLAIMQNNAANLAASLGDGLKPFLDAVAVALKAMTDLLAGMSPEVKSAVVGIGGLAVVLGTIVPIINQFRKGWVEMAESIRTHVAIMKAKAKTTEEDTSSTTANTGASEANATASETAGTAKGAEAKSAGENASAMASDTTETEANTAATEANAAASERAAAAKRAEAAAASGSSEAISDVADTAADMADSVDDVTDATDAMGDVAKEAAKAGDAVGDTADTMGDVAKEAAKAGDAIDGVADAADSVGDIADVATDAVDSVTDMAGAMGGVATAGETAAASTGGLSATLAGLSTSVAPVLAVTAAVAELATMLSDLASLVEDGALVNETVASLRDVKVGTLDTSSVEQAKGTIADLRSSFEEPLSTLREFGDAAQQTIDKIGADSALVEQYGSRIEELASKGRLTENEQRELAQAVSTFNDETGAGIQVVDAATGKLNIMTGQVNELTEAYRVQAEQRAYAELYEEAIRKQAEAQIQYDRAMKDLNGTLGENANAFDLVFSNGIDKMGLFKTATETLGTGVEILGARDALEEANQTIEWLGENANSASFSFGSLETAMASAGISAEQYSSLTDEQKSKLIEIQNALVNAGHSLSEYKNLNASQLAQIVAAWNGSVPDIIKAIQAIQASTREAGDGAGPTVDYTEQANARKKELDQAYNDTKKAYDAEYKLQQKELDRQYKAASKASQKYLKDFKKRQKEEVDAFKAATDEKVKEIEREYEAKQKLLDQEYEGYDSEIDEKIKAIEAEQDAEDEARKQRDRQEKLAELNEKVAEARQKEANARTRKSAEEATEAREDAEKSLNDYLDDLRAEDTKSQRDAQIQRLKDQKSALKDQYDDRKKELKESYDLAVSNYKAQREAELKILQEKQEAEYEMVSEAEQAKLEALKESHQNQLEDLKNYHDSQLQILKDANDAEVQAIRDGNAAKEQAAAEHVDNMEAIAKDAATRMAQTVDGSMMGMPTKMAQNMSSGLNLMRGVATAMTAPLGATMSMTVNKMLDPAATMPGLMSRYGTDGLNALVNGFSDETATQALQYVAQRLVHVGTDPASVMPTLEEQFGRDSAWALANGLSDEEATNRVRETSQAIVDANGDIMSVMSILNETYGRDAVIAAANGMSGEDSHATVKQAASDIMSSAMDPFSKMGAVANLYAREAMAETASGISDNGDMPVGNAGEVAKASAAAMDSHKDWAETSGHNLAINFANGMASGNAIQAATNAAMSLAAAAAAYLHHSTPDKGPLRGDDRWGGEMVENWVRSMRSKFGILSGASNQMAGVISDGMTVGDVNADFMQSLVDDMRSKEGELLRQARRMSDIVERGFDPRLTVDAAYEAVGRIDRGRLRRQQMVASRQRVDNSTYAPVININIPEMVVREEADIDRISNRIAVKVQRQLNARIG